MPNLVCAPIRAILFQVEGLNDSFLTSYGPAFVEAIDQFVFKHLAAVKAGAATKKHALPSPSTGSSRSGRMPAGSPATPLAWKSTVRTPTTSRAVGSCSSRGRGVKRPFTSTEGGAMSVPTQPNFLQRSMSGGSAGSRSGKRRKKRGSRISTEGSLPATTPTRTSCH